MKAARVNLGNARPHPGPAPQLLGVAVASGSFTNTGNVFVPQTPEQFSYDDDGNLTQDGRWNYVWDAENRLVSLSSLSTAPAASKKKVDFAYDYQSRRVQKIISTWNGSAYVPQFTNRFVYDGWNLIAILDPQSLILQSFNWGLDLSGTMQGAGGVGGLLSMMVNLGTNAGTHFCSYDGNGNVMVLVNATDGTVSANYEYDPFGQVIRATGPMAEANPFRFSTKYQDDETEHNYYGYRFYNPSGGRWLSRDPIAENGGYNLYGFIANNPVNGIDLLGLALYAFDGTGNNNREVSKGKFTWVSLNLQTATKRGRRLKRDKLR